MLSFPDRVYLGNFLDLAGHLVRGLARLRAPSVGGREDALRVGLQNF